MPRIKFMDSFDEKIDHLHDNYTSLGYDFERNIFKNVLSPEIFSNPLNDTPLRQFERIIEHLVNQVKRIKCHFAFALPKNSKLLN